MAQSSMYVGPYWNVFIIAPNGWSQLFVSWSIACCLKEIIFSLYEDYPRHTIIFRWYRDSKWKFQSVGCWEDKKNQNFCYEDLNVFVISTYLKTKKFDVWNNNRRRWKYLIKDNLDMLTISWQMTTYGRITTMYQNNA